MNALFYNIPVNLIPAYRGRRVIVRSYYAEELVKALSGDLLDNLAAVQLLSVTREVEALADWGVGIPVDVVVLHPQIEFPVLYRYAKLLDKHPLRVCIPVVNGFSKAVTVAASLNFFIKLEIGQPDLSQIEEVARVLNFFLHNPSVGQPIEYFHSVFLSFYHDEPATLWDVQEEDPARIRYVTEDGRETVARRFVREGAPGDLDNFVNNLQSELLGQEAECCHCDYFSNCGGYFKWPNRAYRCDGVKGLFQTLKAAGEEMKDNVALISKSKGGAAQ